MKSLLKQKVQLAFGFAILTLLLVGTVSYHWIAVSEESTQWVWHTHEVLSNIQDLSLSMEGIDSSSREYVLTGKESALEPYYVSIQKVEEDREAIRSLTVDNALQQRQFPAIAKLAAENTQRADRLIQLRRTQGMAAAAAAMGSGPGDQIKVDFQAAVDKLQSEELRLRALRSAKAERYSSQSNIFLIVGTLFGILFVAAAGWGTARDTSKREVAEEKYRGLLEAAPDGMVVVNEEGKIVLLNAQAEKHFGYRRDELLGQKVTAIIPEGFAERLIADGTRTAAEALAQQIGTGIELNGRRKDDSEFPIEIMLSPLESPEGILVTAAIRDITVRKDAEKHLTEMTEQVIHSAEHDFLTGLPNRLLLNDRIGQAIALAQRHAHQVAVLFLDLDGFKHINDSLGHSAGDKLLQSVAGRLADCVRAPDTVSRQGGDEFVVLLQEVKQAEDITIAARRMMRAVEKTHFIDDHELHVTASIGVSLYPDDGLDAETLIKNADTAMYQAKEDAGQSCKFFRPEMNVRAVERQSIEEDLRRALELKEFTLYYQPKINLSTGAIIGAEALIRWMSPTRGQVPPLDFIPIAEESGLILPIGAWVLQEACMQSRAWLDAGLPATTMAVNVSSVQFRQEDFLKDLFATLSKTGMDAKYLELEVTESVLMRHAEVAASVLQTLRDSGVRVSVDDFGTGYSSLSYLQKFPLDALKIDQSFVREISTRPDETSIVRAIISMGRSLNLRIIAEGVETAGDLAFLKAQGCDEGQGYYFSRPVPAEQFAKLLAINASATAMPCS